MSHSIPQGGALLVVGTRPECLKLASVYHALKTLPGCGPVVMNSGQHQAMVEQMLSQLDVPCDIHHTQMTSSSLFDGVRKLRASIRKEATRINAALLVAQGDTSTAYATALAARDASIPFAHVEAGLRTDHPYHPFPEEYFRRKISRIASLHFAPTRSAAENLRREGIAASRIIRSGNTIVDQLRAVLEERTTAPLPAAIEQGKRIITLTLHRRENQGHGVRQVGTALRQLMDADKDLVAICPLPPNPATRAQLTKYLTGHHRIHLVEPLGYPAFIALLRHSSLVITDSGGIQEEAPYLGVPLLIVRRNTERVEEATLGNTILVEALAPVIFREARCLLALDPPCPIPFTDAAPNGHGYAGQCIARHLSLFMRSFTAKETHLYPTHANEFV